jgi:glyoxylase-like metal-dependent hydrolase (beta-lactamase superfamily II)
VTTRVVPLRRQISNAFLLLGERAVLVDAGAPGDIEPLLEQLREHGVAPEQLALLVLTHGHADHTGAAATLAAAGVPVAIGAQDAGLLETGVIDQLPVTGPAGALLRPFIRRMRSTPATAQIHVSEPLRLDAYGVAATMVPVGGHTPGSCVVLLDGGDAVVGDLFRAGFGLGRIRPGHPLRHYFAEHPDSVRQGLDLVLRHGPALLHVAHGGPSVPADEIRRRLDQIAPRTRP